MKVLAFSDIHHNLVAVRKLRAFQSNSFDAIIVAGDIGNEAAVEFFKILSSFKCPILYVFGNWDHSLSYRKNFGQNTHLVHLNVIRIGNLNFTGFSGCPTNWGQNPIALRLQQAVEEEHKESAGTDRQANTSFWKDIETFGLEAAKQRLRSALEIETHRRYAEALALADRKTLELNREALGAVVKRNGLDPRSTIVIAHERSGYLRRQLPGALLHLYGHIHRFSDTVYAGTRYVNVAALDRQISVRPRHKRNWITSDCRNLNAGSFVTIEVRASRDPAVKCSFLPHRYSRWTTLKDRRFNGIDWIPEELKWAKSSDPKILQYEVSIL